MDSSALFSADAKELAGKTGIPADKILDYQAIARKKEETAIIRI